MPAADLRDRRRTKTRLAIQTEALRLFSDKGYAETTVEEIADAAAISARTFFRYFPTKEDAVMWDEYDPEAPELLQARPRDEPVAESFRAVMREALGGLYRRDPERLLTRVRLASTVPELRARFLEQQAEGVELVAAQLAGADDLRVRVLGHAVIGAVTVALDAWRADDGRNDLLALLDEAFAALRELR
ncbi:MAG TPA: TetR family transcriptional regulator [Solirubrobacteraceae bacterium]|jgi:AcrR family transcriptional regulator